MKNKKFNFKKPESSEVQKFRKYWFKKGYELINITTLCEPKLGTSGWCNDFNEPDETIHHIQLWYRDEIIANISEYGIELIDNKKYCYFDDFEGNFIIFRKVKNEKSK